MRQTTLRRRRKTPEKPRPVGKLSSSFPPNRRSSLPHPKTIRSLHSRHRHCTLPPDRPPPSQRPWQTRARARATGLPTRQVGRARAEEGSKEGRRRRGRSRKPTTDRTLDLMSARSSPIPKPHRLQWPNPILLLPRNPPRLFLVQQRNPPLLVTHPAQSNSPLHLQSPTHPYHPTPPIINLTVNVKDLPIPLTPCCKDATTLPSKRGAPTVAGLSTKAILPTSKASARELRGD
jgi:hypothetical protein